MKLQTVLLPCLLCLLAGPSLAYADITAPERAACYDKKLDQACTFGGSHRGTCVVHRCTRGGQAFDCVMCTEVTETAEGRSYLVEPEGAFAPPLFEPEPVATASSAASDPQPAPPPVAPSGCGRCAAGLRDSSGGGAALAVWLLACAWLARAASSKRR